MSLLMRVSLTLWSAIWTLGAPALLLYLRKRARKDPIYSKHLNERFGHYVRPMPEAVWVHAVSLGEMRSAVPLIRALLARGEQVVTTHFTPAGRGEAERVFATEIAAGQMQAVWVPVETASAYRRFFSSFRPQYGLVMEIEIWPRMVFSARAAGVPLFMCNAQYPKSSLARDSSWIQLRQQVMRGFSGALVKSDLQAERFTSIGVRNIAVTGELRFDQPIPQALVSGGIAARSWIGAKDKPVLVIASSVEGEDPTYLHAIRKWRTHLANQGAAAPLCVYVPRRPERFDDVAKTLTAAGLNVLRRSALGAEFDPAKWGTLHQVPDVFLGDSLGEMYGYLSMGDLVVVGGGFTPHGAHNIIEPLALGKPVLTGPATGTIEYPFVEAEAAGVARALPDADALALALISGFAPEPSLIEAFIHAHAGGTERTIAALPHLLAAARLSPSTA